MADRPLSRLGRDREGHRLFDAVALAGHLSGLRALLRWDPPRQRYQAFAPARPDPDNDFNAVRPGDVLWVEVAEAGIWRMPALGAAGPTTLAAGWNVVAWGGASEVDPASAFAPLGDRLLMAYGLDADRDDFRGYTPALAAAQNTLTRIRRHDILSIQISPGPPVALSPAGVEAPEA